MNDGGPAYPYHAALLKSEGGFVLLDEYGLCEHGMSLRAYFAGQIVANGELIGTFSSGQAVDDCVPWIFDKAQAMVDEELRRQEDAP